MDEMQAEKLERFTESVNIEVEEHITNLINDANEQSRITLRNAEDEALLDAYNKIQKSVKETEARYRRMYALEEQKMRMDSLRHRDELSEKIFSGIEDKLYSFAKTSSYCDYLMKIASEEKYTQNAVFAISPNDKAYSDKLSQKTGCRIQLDDSIKIGGVMIIDSERGLIIDRTFDNALEEQKKSFSSKYSFKSEC